MGAGVGANGEHVDVATVPLVWKKNEGSLWMVIFSVAVAVCGSFVFGVSIGYSAPTQAQIREDLGLSLSEYSVFGSTLTIGAVIGAVASGRISDFIGRKGTMGASAFVCIIGWLAIYFANGAILLDFGRLFTGFGLGVFSYVVPVYIAEIAPKNLRGVLTTLTQLLVSTGISVTYLLGIFVTWRTLILTGLVPCLILLAGLFFIPESPRWLAKVGRKDFQVALQKLRGKHADILLEAAEMQESIGSLQTETSSGILDLLTTYIRPVIVGVGLMVLQQFAGVNGVLFYASETFVSAGFPSGNLGTILIACIQVPITLLGALLMDRSGRKPLLVVSASGMSLGAFIAATSFFLKEHGIFMDYAPNFALSGVLIYLGAFAIGMAGIPWVIMSEIFPINVKGHGGSLVTLVSWFGSWVVSFAFNFLLNWSSSGTFLLFSVVSALAVVFVGKVVPETRGQTLEEIQVSMSS